MNRTHTSSNAFRIVIAVAASLAVGAEEVPRAQALRAATGTRVPIAALWQDRGPGNSLDLVSGSGGKAHQPIGKFTFVKEDRQGTSPKFEVSDEKGVVWKVKLGEEARAETAATRLVWAAGYFADEDYYLAEIHVANMPGLQRGRQFVSTGGVVHGVRLERKVKGQKKSENWSWYKNPFTGTKELNGLKVLMALTNNWDLKEVNNAVYQEKDGEPRYVVSDLGATFGKSGNPFVRSKSNVRDYRGTKFIQAVKPEHVDFSLNSRPFFLAVFNLPNYITRTRMQGIVKHIPRTHAQWLGQILGQLSGEQIRDCFRASGYPAEEVEGFAKVVEGRIAELKKL